MSMNSKYSSKNLSNFFSAYLESISSDKDSAREYLTAQGLNPDDIVKEGLKRIKKLQLQLKAKHTQSEFEEGTDLIKQKVREQVKLLTEKIGFSFAQFIKQEQIALHHRNLETLTDADIKDFLEEYFYLKFKSEQNRGNS
ncbi:MAG: hypothetical protein ACLQQ4_14550 [Bacteroidia bacterium]